MQVECLIVLECPSRIAAHARMTAVLQSSNSRRKLATRAAGRKADECLLDVAAEPVRLAPALVVLGTNITDVHVL